VSRIDTEITVGLLSFAERKTTVIDATIRKLLKVTLTTNGFMRDADVLAARSPKIELDPWVPYAFLTEPERTALGRIEDVATVFLTNRECPFRCTMCDLWKYTLNERVPPGAIPAQIQHALTALPPAKHIKLYNAGNFFDSMAIPPEDHPDIVELVAQFQTVIVENHPRLTDDRVLRFRDLLLSVSQTHPARRDQSNSVTLSGTALAAGSCSTDQPGARADPFIQSARSLMTDCDQCGHGPRLEVALGLETVHPESLAYLNKRMTVADFDRAAAFLRQHDIDVRAFVLLKPPGMNERDAIEWCLKSVEHAFNAGATVCSVIPTRAGNGIMDHLAAAGQFAPPTIKSMEEVMNRSLELAMTRSTTPTWTSPLFLSGTALAASVSFGKKPTTNDDPLTEEPSNHSWSSRASTPRVFMDLWDAEKFCSCSSCGTDRIERLRRMNLSQTIEPRIACRCEPT
jgi:archaeosine synthase beta-subunit